MSDPSQTIDEPITAALDGIVFRAVLSFVAVAAVTAVPLLLHLTPVLHAAAHAVLPASWMVYALLVLVRRPDTPDSDVDPWAEASTVDAGAARAARIAFIALPVGWLAAAAGLLAHHLSTNAGTAEVLGVDVPILAVGWFVAVLAWRSSTRAVLGVALRDRGRRLRSHLEGLRQSR